MYKARYFVIQELVPRSVFVGRGEKAWSLLDDRALRTLDAIREEFGVTVVNTWHRDGDREWSGLRTPNSPYHRIYSQHSYGRAFDCIFPEHPSEDVRAYILAHPRQFPHIRGVERGVSWLHFDVGNRPGENINVFGKG
jgi:hypothetical protein